MSGIVGFINLDNAPVDRELVGALTANLSMRGPDAQRTWTDTSVALGHALLRTHTAAREKAQPHTIDATNWIVADARIDAREQLIAQLGLPAAAHGTLDDPDLILLAYQKWGADCVLHLLGDFAFAIWDGKHRTLFCARDHFGVRPFYYAKTDHCFVFSNDLNTVREHPSVSMTLNETAILNFLILHYQPRVDLTAFADVAALPPATRLRLHDGRIEVDEYWTLPIEEPLRFRQRSEYVEGFREVFGAAVADRADVDRAGIHLSGGMDSTSIAAALTCLCTVSPTKLTAFTYGYTRKMSDTDPHYAQMVANWLAIPWRFGALDDGRWFEGWDRLDVRFPEPVVNRPLWKKLMDPVCMAALNEGIRVFFCGYGPDLMMRYEPSYYWDSIRELEPLSMVRAIVAFVREYHRRPPLNVRGGVRRLIASLTGDDGSADSAIAPLLTADFANRKDLPRAWWQYRTKRPTHPRRRIAYNGLTEHFWTLVFRLLDAANWGAPIEFRFPYFDVRVVRYFLRVPVVPWCTDKALMREAMRGLLPPEVLARPKTTPRALPSHPVAAWVNTASVPGRQLSKYVIPAKVQRLFEQFGMEAEVTRRLVALDHWMEHHAQVPSWTARGDRSSPVTVHRPPVFSGGRDEQGSERRAG